MFEGLKDKFLQSSEAFLLLPLAIHTEHGKAPRWIREVM